MPRHQPTPIPPSSETALLLQRINELQQKLAVVEGQQIPGIAGIAGRNFQIQTGVVTVGAGAVGFNTFEITLPIAWKYQHMAFLCSLHPLSANGTWITNSGPYDGTGTPSLIKGFIVVNTPSSQNVDVYWTSIGR